MRLARRKRQKGSAVVEMALMSWPLLFMLMGVSVVGFNLGRNIQVTQICRDAGSMFVRGIDFSKDSNKDLLVRLANPMGLQKTGGNGVVYLSKITYISQAKCTALGLTPCNANQHVIMQRLVIGNPSLKASEMGTPNAALLDTKGLVTNYFQEASAVANVPYVSLVDGEYAYIAETFFPSPDFDLVGYQVGTGNYTRALF